MARSKLASLSQDQVEQAQKPSKWDLTNETLYRLCRDHPHHTSEQAILAKLNIIGRVYAAAIERRKNVLANETNESFYVSRVVPIIMKTPFDKWIDDAKSAEPSGPTAFSVILEVHKRTTDLFNEISGMDKRSLASKYLHFHVPDLFFIYDSRAQRAIDSLAFFRTRNLKAQTCDRVYAASVAKCRDLQSYCNSEFGARLTPRELDNLLLSISAESGTLRG